MASPHQDSLPEHSTPSRYRYADCVERTGLGEAFRKRGLRPTTPTQQAEELNTTADSNTVRENGILNSGHVDGDVVTGGPGARAEHPNQDTHTFRIENPGSVAFYYQSKRNTINRSEHNITGDYTSNQHHPPSASSHALSPLSQRQATTSSESSISRTVVESSGIDASAPSIRVSETHSENFFQSECSLEGDGQYADQICTPEEFVARIDEMGAKAIQTCEKICCMLPSYVRRKRERNELWKQINTHKHRLKIDRSMLPGSIRQLSCKPELQTFLSRACSHVVKALASFQKQLDRPGSFTRRHLANEGEDARSTSFDYNQKLKGWDKQLQSDFGTYAKAANVLNVHRPQSDPPRLTQILVKLSAESHASSDLKRFLCLACPQQCHRCHTAYLSLEPKDPSPSPALDSDTPLRPGGKDTYEATWHIAFKSTIAKEPRLIWLRVLSNVFLKTASPPSPTVQLSAADRPQSLAVMGPQTATNTRFDFTANPTSKKRRASSSLPEPAQKMFKQACGQPEAQEALNSERQSGIEICPEYLTWNKQLDSEHAIIKMTDNTLGDHQMFYLPRSSYREGAKSISLGDAIKHKLHQRSKLVPSGTLLWVAQTARLVAEAVVRFDLRDSDGTLEESIVFHEAGPIKLDYLTLPFLEVKLEKSSSSFSTGTVHDRDKQQQWLWEPRKHVLLNLGVVLVQLGTHRDDAHDLERPPNGPGDKQNFILTHAAKTQNGVGREYASAVRSCASLFGSAVVAGEEEFLESFLKKVVQPLRHCEEILRMKGCH